MTEKKSTSDTRRVTVEARYLAAQESVGLHGITAAQVHVVAERLTRQVHDQADVQAVALLQMHVKLVVQVEAVGFPMPPLAENEHMSMEEFTAQVQSLPPNSHVLQLDLPVDSELEKE